MPAGWINERVNTGDWDDNLGGVFYGSCWCEVSLMLTIMEVPGIYVRTDTAEVHAFDHVRAEAVKENGHLTGIRVCNPTRFPARVKLLVEDAGTAARPLGQNYLWGCRVLELTPGEEKLWTP
jgi:hypothetical protein